MLNKIDTQEEVIVEALLDSKSIGIVMSSQESRGSSWRK